MSHTGVKRRIWWMLAAVGLCAAVFDLSMTHARRGFIALSPVTASSSPQATVALATSQDLTPAKAIDDSTLTYAEVKELVYLALDRDTSTRAINRIIHADDWVGIKVNLVTAPLLDNSGNKVGGFWQGPGAINDEPHWGTTSDLRATKALIEYLIERIGPKRISIMAGSGEWAKTGSPYFSYYNTDGYNITWDKYDGMSYQGVVNAFNAAQSTTTVDIVDLNDDDPELHEVPGGGLQLVSGGVKRNWGYEDWKPGFGTPRNFWYMPETLMDMDKVIDQAVLKTTSPGITVFMKNYVGCVSMRGYGAGPGKSSVIDGVSIMTGYTDLVRIRPPDYNLATGFWAGSGWYGENIDYNHNVVVAGQNIVAAEAVAARVMGFNPRDLQQVHLGHDVGLGSFEESDYTVIGGDPAQLEKYLPSHPNFKPSGFQQWAMLGPFSESNIAVDLLSGESSATGEPGDQAGGQTWWKYSHRPGYPEPYTDFTHLSLGSLNGKTLYAYVEVECDAAVTGYLRFGSDGAARVWVNGSLILDVAAGAFAHRAPAIALVQGDNDVLVKTVGSASGGGFALSLTDGTRMLTEVRPEIPPDPDLAAPVLIAYGGTFTDSPSPVLKWCAVSGATSYTLEYGSKWDFTGATAVAGITATKSGTAAPLADGAYYWRVKTHSGATESGWSNIDSFTISPLFEFGVPVLLALSMAGVLIWRGRAA